MSSTGPIQPRRSPQDAGHRQLIWITAGCVLLPTLAAHSPALWCDFVNWDDPANILDNTHIHGLGADELRWMWTTRHLGVYEPLSWLIKALIHAAFGYRAWAFHGLSWLLQGVNAVLFFLIARQLFSVGAALEHDRKPRSAPPHSSSLIKGGKRGIERRIETVSPSNHRRVLFGSAVAALVFGVHPLRVECVAWASGQPYVLAGFFALLCTWAYLRSVDSVAHSSRTFALAVTAYACSLHCKAIAVPLPAVLLLLDVYPLRRLGGKAGWLRKGCGRVWLDADTF